MADQSDKKKENRRFVQSICCECLRPVENFQRLLCGHMICRPCQEEVGENKCSFCGEQTGTAAAASPISPRRPQFQRSNTIVQYREQKNPCDLCILDGKRRQSEFFCLDCENGLCDACFSIHDRKANFVEHLAFLLRENNCVPYCSDHGKPIRSYCDTCGLLVCGHHIAKECRMISIHQALMKFLNRLEQMTDTMKSLRRALAGTKYEMQQLLSQQEKAVLGMKQMTRGSQLSLDFIQGQERVINDQEALCVQYSEQIDALEQKLYTLNELIVYADKILSSASRFSIQLLEVSKQMCDRIDTELAEHNRDVSSKSPPLFLMSERKATDDSDILNQATFKESLHDITVKTHELMGTSRQPVTNRESSYAQKDKDMALSLSRLSSTPISSTDLEGGMLMERSPSSMSRGSVLERSSFGNQDQSVPDSNYQSRENTTLSTMTNIASGHASKATRRNSENANPKGLIFTLSQGHRRGLLKVPIDLMFVSVNHLAVAEYENERIQVFDSKGDSIYRLGSDEIIPQGITVTAQDDIAVTDKHTKCVIIFLKDREQKILGEGQFSNPHGITAARSGHLIVTDVDRYQIVILTLSDEIVTRFGCYGNDPEQFAWPGYVVMDKDDKILVSDSDNGCVKRFSQQGEFIDCFGSEDGLLTCPKGIAVTKSGNILVADRLTNSVSMFDHSGHFIHNVISGQVVTEPRALAVSVDGLLAITEYMTDNCKVFQMFS